MHRFTDSMPGRAMTSRSARSCSIARTQAKNITTKRRHTQPSSDPFSARQSTRQSTGQTALASRYSQPWVLPLLVISLAGGLIGCGSADSKGTNTAATTVDTAEVFNAPPSLTIVAPEGTRPDNSAFIQVAENSLNVTQVAAEDVPGSTLIYRLQDGEDKDKFVLDESTGTLRFKDLPDWEDPIDADTNNNYMLLWQVISSSGEARSQFMVIQVTDLPE